MRIVPHSVVVWIARRQLVLLTCSRFKVMSLLLRVRKCFLASSPLGRHSLELRASVSRVFSPIARDWLKIRFCIGAASLRPCSVLLEYLSYAHWLLRLSTSIYRQTIISVPPLIGRYQLNSDLTCEVDEKGTSLVQHGYGAVLTRSVDFAAWNF